MTTTDLLSTAWEWKPSIVAGCAVLAAGYGRAAAPGAGIPAELAERALAVRPVARVEQTLSRATVAWIAGIGAIVLWHVPALFNAGLDHEAVHVAG